MASQIILNFRIISKSSIHVGFVLGSMVHTKTEWFSLKNVQNYYDDSQMLVIYKLIKN